MAGSHPNSTRVCDDALTPPAGRTSDGDDPLAMIVVHGMGQPVPFQTLEEVVDALRKAEMRAGRPEPSVCVRRVELPAGGGKEPFNRVELRIGETQSRPEGSGRLVHLYEVYWAPVPEGKVSGGDVVRFLLLALWNNRWILGTREFLRYLFGGLRSYPIRRVWTALQLGGVALVLLSLLVLNAAVALVSVVGLLNLSAGGGWLTNGLLRSLLEDMAWLGAPMVCFLLGVWLLPAWLPKPRAGDPHVPRVSSASLVSWAFVTLGVFGLIAVTVLVGLHMASNEADHVPIAKHLVVEFAIVWMVLVGISRWVRLILVQYVGDVAAYISAHTVNRFWQIRSEIFQIAMRVARGVYGARDAAGNVIYRDVVVVGHSLGSLIAYDMLNGAMLEDYLAARSTGDPARAPLGITERTAALVTSGSPLDKVAFLFRIQQPMNAIVREVLATSIQPMILNPDFRPRRWLNLYSWNDLISGHLDYYDPPGKGQPGAGAGAVENLCDHQANHPLLAHNQYWANPLFGDRLLKIVSER